MTLPLSKIHFLLYSFTLRRKAKSTKGSLQIGGKWLIFAQGKNETGMYQKFIITSDGTLRFGRVYQHRELLQRGEGCDYGGGLWKVCHERRAVLLYGRSFDFGPPELNCIRRIEWGGIDGMPRPLFFLPRWPDEEAMIPVYAR